MPRILLPVLLLRTIVILLILMVVGSGDPQAADWPQCAGNAARNGFTEDVLPDSLNPLWVRKAAHRPSRAWPHAANRMRFDDVYQPVVAGEWLLYGSSSDNRVVALDAKTGRHRWDFFTEGPVRLAPAVWRDIVFVGSDDGYLYALSLRTGKCLWRKRGGPKDQKILGNGRLISRWPVRGGPVVFENKVYFGAGIWPSEGIYIHALDAETGTPLWLNRDSGGLRMKQPHGAMARSGISAQGYLAANDDYLLVPTGRGVPAVLDRRTGKLLHYNLAANKSTGGTMAAILSPQLFICGGGRSSTLYDLKTGRNRMGAGTKIRCLASLGDPEHGFILAGHYGMAAFRCGAQSMAQRVWRVEKPHRDVISAVATPKRLVLGKLSGSIQMLDIQTRKPVSSVRVPGKPLALAVAHGRLYVSTDLGEFHCFSSEKGGSLSEKKLAASSRPTASALMARAAEELIAKTKRTSGYCVDLQCGDGTLLMELAQRTKMRLIGLEGDPRKVSDARQRLLAQGLYGDRVTILHGTNDVSSLPPFFADLVVSSADIQGINPLDRKVAQRLSCPSGGLFAEGRAGTITVSRRGPLEGAGEWTHHLADAANSANSNDELVKPPLKVLWFKSPDAGRPNRKSKSAAPLYRDGKVILPGEKRLQVVNAYNGTPLWERTFEGGVPVARRRTYGAGSNVCVGDDSIFFVRGRSCERIDLSTGKTRSKFVAPSSDESTRWGYLAHYRGLVYGSVADMGVARELAVGSRKKGNPEDYLFFSRSIFALNAATGELRWQFRADATIPHSGIAAAKGRLFLIDRSAPSRSNKDSEGAPSPISKTRLLALDAGTGKVLWKASLDLEVSHLAHSERYDVLLASHGRTIQAFGAANGRPMWQRQLKKSARPILNGNILRFKRGSALNLQSGKTIPNTECRPAYGCGFAAASKHLMVFRSGTLGYLDFSTSKLLNYGGVRPGCWVNAIVGGGLVHVPAGDFGCSCSYQMQVDMALIPDQLLSGHQVLSGR